MSREDLFVVELKKNVWLSDVNADSGNPWTVVRICAKEFDKFKDAKAALVVARKSHKFYEARIERVETSA